MGNRCVCADDIQEVGTGMKFRKLKKLDFVIYSDLECVYFINNKGKLTEYSEWEYDNGLYIQSGVDEYKGNYKRLRKLIKDTKKDKYSALREWINKGKCHRCGCKLTDNNFKFNDSSLICWFEQNYFYCDSCKEAQVKEFEEFMLKYEESEED